MYAWLTVRCQLTSLRQKRVTSCLTLFGSISLENFHQLNLIQILFYIQTCTKIVRNFVVVCITQRERFDNYLVVHNMSRVPKLFHNSWFVCFPTLHTNVMMVFIVIIMVTQLKIYKHQAKGLNSDLISWSYLKLCCHLIKIPSIVTADDGFIPLVFNGTQLDKFISL